MKVSMHGYVFAMYLQWSLDGILKDHSVKC